ncbi:MAG: hypothetical protein K2X49_16645 [Acetobacteraceae bacterium]|nr:hypothetical protein [Acetobacteraceae bacterium]
MFGFGEGPIGPDEKFLTGLEIAVRKRRAFYLPGVRTAGPDASVFRDIRNAHRTAPVTLQELKMLDMRATWHPRIDVLTLPLPARNILFEFEMVEPTTVDRRVVWVSPTVGQGSEAQIQMATFLRMKDRRWVLTMPFAVRFLDEPLMTLQTLASATTSIELDSFAEEILLAIGGLRVLAAREESRTATRH